MSNSINPDHKSYVRAEDYKGTNKSMPQIEDNEDANVFYELDENGNAIRRFVDYEKDGNIDVISNLDADGKVTDEIIDEDRDGKADLHVSYDYNDKGEITARHVDTDMDGNINVLSGVNNSNMIYSDDIDVDDNGTFDVHVDYTYDSEGGTQRVIDYDRDGVPDVVSHVGADGVIKSEEMDTDLNGELDTHAKYGTDENGYEIVTNQRPIEELKDGLPEGWTSDDGKILDENGKEVGMVLNLPKDGNIVQAFYKFLD